MPESSIRRELDIGEVISQTFELFRRNFSKYLTIYLVLEAVMGIAMALANYYVVLPTLPPRPTQQQVMNWLPGFLRAALILVFLFVMVSAIFGTIASGTAIKITSEVIENRQPSLAASARFTISKLLSIWALSLITFLIILLGLIALIIPGIILAIMLSLAIPALLIENKGVFESMDRSRKLVGGRWLKSLGVYLVVGIIVVIASIIARVIVSPIDVASIRTVLSSLISALFIPIVPISLTIYYYSNAARIAPPQLSATPTSTARFAPLAVNQYPSRTRPSAKSADTI